MNALKTPHYTTASMLSVVTLMAALSAFVCLVTKSHHLEETHVKVTYYSHTIILFVNIITQILMSVHPFWNLVMQAQFVTILKEAMFATASHHTSMSRTQMNAYVRLNNTSIASFYMCSYDTHYLFSF